MATSLYEFSNEKLSADIAEVLRNSDLALITSKKVRKQLEEKYGIDLIDRKDTIDKLALEQIVKLTNCQNSEKCSKSKTSISSNGQMKKEASQTNNTARAELSSSASSSSESEIDDDDAPPKKKLKKIAPKKKTEAQYDSTDEQEIDDADLARKLQAEDGGFRKTRHGAKPPKVKTKVTKGKNKKAKKGSDNDDDDEEGASSKKKRPNKYTEQCYLSPQLAAIMNENRLKRSDVVKKMWAIVKEQNLYDPKNKQFMICDEQMQSVFGRKRVRIFGMMKMLKFHIFSPAEYESRQS